MAENNTRFERRKIALADLELDPDNPRIRLRRNADENQCIERLASTEASQLRALCDDIAQSGLVGLDAIVVFQDGDRFVVKDGNRRVSSLKMLANPQIAPEALKPRVVHAAKNALPLPDPIECEVTSNQKLIEDVMARKHLGAGKGEGLRPWEAVERSRFELDVGRSGADEQAARLVKYIESNSIAEIPADFPITTLTRFLNSETIAALGFSDLASDPPKLADDVDVLDVHRALKSIVEDLATGRVNVKRQAEQQDEGSFTFMSAQDREAYAEEVRVPRQQGANESAPEGEASRALESGRDAGQHASTSQQVSGANNDTSPGSQTTATGVRRTTPASAPSDRPHVAKPRTTHGVKIPVDQIKARTVHKELSDLNASKFVCSASVLVRMFVELSVDHYVGQHQLKSQARKAQKNRSGGSRSEPPLADKMTAAADHMKQHSTITKAQKDAVYEAVKKDELSLETLNAAVHSEGFISDRRSLNTLWDNLLPFLNRCWT